ncbi:MAG TPA: ADP-ribosylglycohydrolase family protein, partial [Calditrichaeota bacterium]|nr:ADP-ribosylglycohydrolase family protein [Calditrichota bacterium]
MLSQKTEKFNYQSYLTELGKDIELKLKPNFITKPQFKSWLSEWNKNQEKDFMSVYNETVQEALNSLRDIFKFIRDEKNTKDSLSYFGCYAPSTKGSGISTVIGGIYLAIKHYQTPEKAILEAVNSIGTDTDSIAAFAGGLIGCLYETDIIADHWKGVQDSEYLNEIALNLYEISQQESNDSRNNQVELNIKSLNEIAS